MPFFIPMEGCPYQCIYCDQRAISGQQSGPTAAAIAAAISACPAPVEAAFYGGTFTALPPERRRYYLEAVAPFVASGQVSGLRVSTRPDCVDEARLAELAAYGVGTVELGVQSFSDPVLRASGRGYDGQTARRAAALVRQARLTLGVQLMTGLPEQTAALSRADLRAALAAGAQLLRLYPTLVLAGTPLAALYRAGAYQPQTVDEAVAVCRDQALLAEQGGATLIRVGINPSPAVAAALVAGPYGPAFGHLVKGAAAREQLRVALARAGFAPQAVSVPRRELPVVIGQGAVNKRWLEQRLGYAVRWHGDDSLAAGSLALAAAGRTFVLTRRQFRDFYLSTLP